MLRPDALPELKKAMSDSDSVVRYWATLGVLMRGSSGVADAHTELRTALKDSCADVRITAAQGLGQFGSMFTAIWSRQCGHGNLFTASLVACVRPTGRATS